MCVNSHKFEIYGNKITSNPLSFSNGSESSIGRSFWENACFLCSCPCSQILLVWTLNICPQLAKNKLIRQNVCHYPIGAGTQIHTHIEGHGKGRHCGFSLRIWYSFMMIHVSVTLEGPRDVKNRMTGLIQWLCWNEILCLWQWGEDCTSSESSW